MDNSRSTPRDEKCAICNRPRSAWSIDGIGSRHVVGSSILTNGAPNQVGMLLTAICCPTCGAKYPDEDDRERAVVAAIRSRPRAA